MGSQKCIPAGRECFVHLGLNCSNPLSFQFAEGFWLIASGAKRDDLSFSDAKTAGIRSGLLNNAGSGLGFHVAGLFRNKFSTFLAALGCFHWPKNHEISPKY
jgi:hypothetical protein